MAAGGGGGGGGMPPPYRSPPNPLPGHPQGPPGHPQGPPPPGPMKNGGGGGGGAGGPYNAFNVSEPNIAGGGQFNGHNGYRHTFNHHDGNGHSMQQGGSGRRLTLLEQL